MRFNFLYFVGYVKKHSHKGEGSPNLSDAFDELIYFLATTWLVF